MTDHPTPRRAMPLLEFHETLLADTEAQTAFRKAIFEITRGGETVLEIGTGTGIHAMFFCQAGARLVHAVEHSVIIELARLICDVNGFSDRLVFHHQNVETLVIPDRVDIIATHLGLTDTLALLPDMKARHLREGGVTIPAGIEMFCAPVEDVNLAARVDFWNEPRYGLTFQPMRLLAERTRFSCRVNAEAVIGKSVRIAAYDFSTPVTGLAASVECDVLRDATLHGIALWYTETLSPEVMVSSAPGTTLPEQLWPNQFLPCAPVAVRQGDRVIVSLNAVTFADDWTWEINVV